MADFLLETYIVISSFVVSPLRVLSNCFPPPITNSVIRILPYGFLGSICCGLDAIFMLVQYQSSYLRALVDNTAHGLIAFVSWCVVSEIQTRKDVLESILCGLIACAIDVDHFLAAKSFRLQDARHLKNRPFLHSTTVVFIVVPILQVWLAQNVSYLRSLPYLFAVAVISHHLRDGHRRGLWFWPLGSTPPLPYWVYIICVMALPCFVKDIKRSIEKFNVVPISRQTTPLMDV